MSRRPLLSCRRSGIEGTSMYDITIDEFPPDRLAAIVHWRNDPAVNRYLRQGILTLETVQAWYTQYFSRAEHQLFAVYADKTLIGYCTLSHIDTTHRSCEIGIVIGDPHYWNKGLGASVITRLTTLAFTRYHLHRVYAVMQGGLSHPGVALRKWASSMRADGRMHGRSTEPLSIFVTMRF